MKTRSVRGCCAAHKLFVLWYTLEYIFFLCNKEHFLYLLSWVKRYKYFAECYFRFNVQTTLRLVCSTAVSLISSTSRTNQGAYLLVYTLSLEIKRKSRDYEMQLPEQWGYNLLYFFNCKMKYRNAFFSKFS